MHKLKNIDLGWIVVKHDKREGNVSPETFREDFLFVICLLLRFRSLRLFYLILYNIIIEAFGL